VIVYLVIGLLAGLLAGLTGLAGGMLFIPALIVFEDFGQVEAQATSLAAILPVALVGAWRQWGYGNVRPRDALQLGLLAVGGVAGGVAVANAIPERALEITFGTLMLVVAAQLAWRARRAPEPQPRAPEPKPRPPAPSHGRGRAGG